MALLLVVPIAVSVVLGLPVHTMRGGDDVNFALRLVNYAVDAIRAGVWIHGWIPKANGGYGSPVFYFYGFLPSLLTGLLTVTLHISAGMGLSIMAGIFRIAAFGTSLVWMKQHVPLRFASWGALLYVSLPFVFLENPFVRFAFAEMLATAILPLGFYAVDKAASNVTRSFFLASVTALLAVTHLPQTALMLVCVVAYAFVKSGWQSAGYSILGGLTGLAVSGFFLCPALLLQPKISASAWTSNPGLDPGNNFLFDPRHLRIGRYQELGEICLHSSWLLAAVFLLLALKPVKTRPALRELILRPMPLVLLVTLAGMTDLAWLAWTKIHFLHQLQFPWRLMPICLLMAAGTAIVCIQEDRLKLSTLKTIVVILVCSQTFIQLIAAGASAGSLDFLPTPISHFIAARLPNYTNWAWRESPAWATAAAGAPEYIPRAAKSAGWTLDMGTDRLLKDPPLPSLSAASDSVQFQQDGATFEFMENPVRAATAILPQFYFPGWEVLPARQGVKIFNDAATGFLRVDSPPGEQKIRVMRTSFRETRIGFFVTTAGLLAMLVIGYFAFARSARWDVLSAPVPEQEVSVDCQDDQHRHSLTRS